MLINKKGQALVEFALVALLFFGISFAVMDLAIMFYVNLTMQNAVRAGTRYAVTGRSDLGTDQKSALIRMIRDNSNGLYDKNLHAPKDPEIRVITPSQVTFDNFIGTPPSGDPKPDDLVVVSLTYTWQLLTPILKPIFAGGQYTFTAKSTMKYEPPATL